MIRLLNNVYPFGSWLCTVHINVIIENICQRFSVGILCLTQFLLCSSYNTKCLILHIVFFSLTQKWKYLSRAVLLPKSLSKALNKNVYSMVGARHIWDHHISNASARFYLGCQIKSDLFEILIKQLARERLFKTES